MAGGNGGSGERHQGAVLLIRRSKGRFVFDEDRL